MADRSRAVAYHKGYTDGVQDGRQSGAKMMREVIEEYLTACGIPFPELPAVPPRKPEGDDTRAGDPTEQIL